jgi:hypothetical protein
MALWAIGLSGFCALALEVLWTRALVFFLDNSTHAFTTILTAFLLGIALGSALIARFIDTRRPDAALEVDGDEVRYHPRGDAPADPPYRDDLPDRREDLCADH